MNQFLYDNIQNLLKENNLTPEQLIADCGLAPNYLDSLQAEKINPSLQDAIKIANYLHISLYCLMIGSDNFYDSDHSNSADGFDHLDLQ